MCPPVVTSITFDKTPAVYTTGQTITATVNYLACCPGPFDATGIDNGGRIWTVTLDDNSDLAILTALA